MQCAVSDEVLARLRELTDLELGAVANGGLGHVTIPVSPRKLDVFLHDLRPCDVTSDAVSAELARVPERGRLAGAGAEQHLRDAMLRLAQLGRCVRQALPDARCEALKSDLADALTREVRAEWRLEQVLELHVAPSDAQAIAYGADDDFAAHFAEWRSRSDAVEIWRSWCSAKLKPLADDVRSQYSDRALRATIDEYLVKADDTCAKNTAWRAWAVVRVGSHAEHFEDANLRAALDDASDPETWRGWALSFARTALTREQARGMSDAKLRDEVTQVELAYVNSLHSERGDLVDRVNGWRGWAHATVGLVDDPRTASDETYMAWVTDKASKANANDEWRAWAASIVGRGRRFKASDATLRGAVDLKLAETDTLRLALANPAGSGKNAKISEQRARIEELQTQVDALRALQKYPLDAVSQPQTIVAYEPPIVPGSRVVVDPLSIDPDGINGITTERAEYLRGRTGVLLSVNPYGHVSVSWDDATTSDLGGQLRVNDLRHASARGGAA